MSPLPFDTLHAESYFYFVRHGQTVANGSGIVQGTSESPLSSLGRRQARRVGRWFAREQIDAIYSSVLGRAQETARIIGSACKKSYHVHSLVQEIDTGIFSNKSWDEVASEFAEEYARFRVESWEAVPGAEKVASLAARAQKYWAHLIAAANDGQQRIVTVLHGGILQWIIKASMGAPQTWMPIIPAQNCGVFMLFVRPEHYDGRESAAVRSGAYCAWQYMNYTSY